MSAVRTVAKMPSARPEYINATGIARMPVPREAFSKCVTVSPSL